MRRAFPALAAVQVLLVRSLVGAAAWSAAVPAVGQVAADAPDRAAVDFFEKKIRPVLATKCYECHSAAAEKAGKLKGGLRLDSAAGTRRGGDSGPVLTPGKPEDSAIIAALRYEGLEMPPSGRLPADVVADFAAWIAAGAADPRTEPVPGPVPGASQPVDVERGRLHWSYRPPVRRAIPRVADSSWPRDPVDAFVLARLEAERAAPAPEADRPTLARRLYFDLVGLPPSPEEIDVFVEDDSPDAVERLVDRLMTSPRFGERWGRHWLDVARFGESLTLRGFIVADSWRYRDYVIESFNADRPFNRFAAEQIAGDLLPAESLAEARRGRIATAFLVLGNWNLEEQDKKQLEMDVVDEQIETIGRAFLAQTIGCARCHDHKFDPIPTRDYYALAGILHSVRSLEHANVSKWLEVPLPVAPAEEERILRHEAEVAALRQEVDLAKRRVAELAARRAESKQARPAAAPLSDLPGIVLDDVQGKRVGTWQHSVSSKRYLGKGYLHDQNAGKGEKTLTFVPELPRAGRYDVRLAYTAGSNRATNVPIAVLSADGETTVTVNQQLPPSLGGHFVSLGQFTFEKNGQGYVLVSNEGTDGHVIVDAVQFLPVDELGEPAAARAGDADPQLDAAAEHLRQLDARLARLVKSGPRRETVPSVVEDHRRVADARVHLRGSVHNLGEVVPRGFLQLATVDPPAQLPRDQSGRRELALWLADRDHPLTARVFVNRVWHWLLGSGLVRTTDNFGTTGEPPSHPELLDNLAVGLMEEGWSAKRLVRRIVLSRTYRQSSSVDDSRRAADPENRLLGRANRRPLEAECLRDAMFAVAGTLQWEMGGRTYPAGLASDYGYRAGLPRRSVYLPAFRNAAAELLRAFDAADPSVPTGVRGASVVAPQALVLMNFAEVRKCADEAAGRLWADAPSADDGERLALAFRRALGRPPTEGERGTMEAFLASVPRGTVEENRRAWTDVLHALFASLDFRFVH